MRKMDQDFCDVCADAIAQAILRKVKHHVVPRRRRTAAFTGYRPPKMPLAARPHQQR